MASKGGKAAHAHGTAHQWTPEEARAAGRKGGKARAEKREEALEVLMAPSDEEPF
jgi:general stress protein YciG